MLFVTATIWIVVVTIYIFVKTDIIGFADDLKKNAVLLKQKSRFSEIAKQTLIIIWDSDK